MSERHAVVVKIGSSSLVDRDGRLDGGFVDAFAGQLAELAKAGKRPVLVTSGAVASGVGILGLPRRPDGIAERQALAAIGQVALAHRWQAALQARGLVAAQVLLTNDDFTDRGRYLNLSAAFRALFAYGAVPVINENDTVAVDELTVGDNDRLSAMVATQLGAELLVLLTDIDGVYDADPRANPSATLLRELDGVPSALLAAAGGAGGHGRGGMRSKLEAARLAGGSGITTVIAPARAPDVLARILAREPVGTRIAARGRATDGRRRWLAMARRVRGRVEVDAGAANAVARDGRSLLPAGITRVAGSFARGDTVGIVDAHGDEIARGLAEMSSDELGRILGLKLAAAAAALGYPLPKAAVHRDNMLVLERR